MQFKPGMVMPDKQLPPTPDEAEALRVVVNVFLERVSLFGLITLHACRLALKHKQSFLIKELSDLASASTADNSNYFFGALMAFHATGLATLNAADGQRITVLAMNQLLQTRIEHDLQTIITKRVQLSSRPEKDKIKAESHFRQKALQVEEFFLTRMQTIL